MQSVNPWDDAAFRSVTLGPVDCDVRQWPDGRIDMRLTQPLGDYPRRYTERLVHWAAATPDAVFLGRRPPGGPSRGVWDTLTYAQTMARVRCIGQALLDRDLSVRRPVVILSENDFENQLLALACTHVGVPYVPVTPAYSLLSRDHVKLKALSARVGAGLVFASSAAAYGAPVRAAFQGCEFVATDTDGGDGRATSFAELESTLSTGAVDRAFAAIGPDDIAKVMFTSGTTADPKGVIVSHRMLCSNRQQVVQALPFCLESPPVLVDWLPWHHTFGGTNNVGLALYCGGAYYLDPGKPVADSIEPTVDALREISPTIYFNTPAGFAALLPHLRSDTTLRERFFARLQLIYYGGAVLPKHLWAGLDEVAFRHLGQRVLIVSGIGSTECGPVPATTSWDPRREPMVGLPVAGIDVRLVPVDDKLELRIRGDCVTPGYWNDAAMTASAFDQDGFFCLGDAVTLNDAQRPQAGLRFDGRIAENFKLSTGTWVHASTLRSSAIAAFSPLAHDVVIAGSGQDIVGALVFPDLAECRALDATLTAAAGAREIVASPIVRAEFQAMLDRLAAQGTGSASRIVRIAIEAEPATLDSGEMTAKAALSAAAVLRLRSHTVADLFAQDPSPRVLRARAV